MSYCRWSSDNFGSDLYVYEDVMGGWTIHVAGNRVVGEVPKWELPEDPGDRAQVEASVVAYRAQIDFLKEAERVAIGLPYDGQTIGAATAGECADWCEALRGMGYRVPEGVIEVLREEHQTSSDGEALKLREGT